ncbi:hypothetical protein C8R41DRAFT_984600 [Lentinula lateritia]|uniref:DNase I-like protein n=1 Tax=Lentinula lateritia TaxID=40482 RepID=A0ABQ8V264_9AGAR|nr:hypothetical protein C8R41DRAFT_984600 [Lentinula lateritia]
MDIDSKNNADGRRAPPLRVENTIDPPVTPPTHHRSRSPHQNAPTLTPPPFTPRKANSSMQQLLMSPCANRSLTGAVCPDGIKLIVRNAYLEDDAVHDPVTIMRNITTLLAASNPELSIIQMGNCTCDVTLRGRVVAVDIAVQTSNGQAFIHRIFGVYAPWDPGNIETQQFWPKLTQIICQTQTSWSLAGDTNATVNAEERSMGGGDARTQFIKFLNDVNGQDLWSLQPERNRMQHWTSRSRSNELSDGSIIDHVVVKAGSMVDGQISIHEGKDGFLPFTDHRAITARMIITSTGNANSFFLPHRIAMNRPRIKYPTVQEKHRHQEFQNLFDERARAKHLQDILVKDDESFMELYNETSKILLSSAETSYGRVPQYRSTARGNRVTNPEIQSQIGYLRSIGGAIRIIQNPDLYYLVSAKSRITYEKFRRKSQQQRINLLKYAK